MTLKQVGKWEYDCLKRDMKLQGDNWSYKGGFEAWYKEVFLKDEAWKEIREEHLKKKTKGTNKCPHCGTELKSKMFDIDGTNLEEHKVCEDCGYGSPALH